MADPGRILAIDYGTRRVGLAMTDPLRIIAQGAGTLENQGDIPARVAALVLQQGVTAIVVGIPEGPDGKTGAMAEEILKFVEVLRGAVSVPVATWDESYTSVDAKSAFLAGGMKKKQRREKARVDEMAARLLLQNYLENREVRGTTHDRS